MVVQMTPRCLAQQQSPAAQMTGIVCHPHLPGLHSASSSLILHRAALPYEFQCFENECCPPLLFTMMFLLLKGTLLLLITSVYGACPRQKGTCLALFPTPWGGNRQETWVTVAGRDLQCNTEVVTACSGSFHNLASRLGNEDLEPQTISSKWFSL